MKTLFKAVSLGLAILLASCSQDKGQEVLRPSNTPVPVSLKMEVDIEDDELRSGLRGMTATFNKDKNWRPEISELRPGDIVPLNLIFSNGNGLVHRTVDFKVNNLKKLVYYGEIDVPGYSSANQWYVTAIRYGKKNGDSYAFAPQMYEVRGAERIFNLSDAIGALHIPYMSGWTPIKDSSTQVQARGSFSVKLRPLGYLLRLKIENRRDHKISLKKILSATRPATIFTGTPTYYFDANFTPDNRIEAMRSGTYPMVSAFVTPDNQTRPLLFSDAPNGIELDAAGGDNTTYSAILLWVMPTAPIKSTQKITIRLSHYKQGAEWYFPYDLTLEPEGEVGLGGLSGLKTLIIPNDYKSTYRRSYTIDYIAKGNIKANGTEVAPGEPGDDITWANFAFKTDARRMTDADWLNILPRSNNDTSGAYDGASNTDGITFFDGISRDIPVGGITYRAASNGSTKLLYAVRTGLTGGGKTAAFRYQMENNGTLTIEMVHLDGHDVTTKTLDQISNNEYWETAYAYGEVVKRTFPAGKEYKVNAGANKVASSVYTYMSSATNGSGRGVLWNVTTGRVNIGVEFRLLSNYPNSNNSGRQVRLKQAKPLPLDPNN